MSIEGMHKNRNSEDFDQQPIPRTSDLSLHYLL